MDSAGLSDRVLPSAAVTAAKLLVWRNSSTFRSSQIRVAETSACRTTLLTVFDLSALSLTSSEARHFRSSSTVLTLLVNFATALSLLTTRCTAPSRAWARLMNLTNRSFIDAVAVVAASSPPCTIFSRPAKRCSHCSVRLASCSLCRPRCRSSMSRSLSNCWLESPSAANQPASDRLSTLWSTRRGLAWFRSITDFVTDSRMASKCASKSEACMPDRPLRCESWLVPRDLDDAPYACEVDLNTSELPERRLWLSGKLAL
mmetsp:Transcript_85931/g.221211  ORF Transcript_85931/g.221211 Transcript_85931/m.221211 type:complete len:259 (-) Transcript_85931:373-1149(-)